VAVADDEICEELEDQRSNDEEKEEDPEERSIKELRLEQL